MYWSPIYHLIGVGEYNLIGNGECNFTGTGKHKFIDAHDFLLENL